MPEEGTIVKKIISAINHPVEVEGWGISSVYDASHYNKLMWYMERIRNGEKRLLTQLVDEHGRIFAKEKPLNPLFAPDMVDISPNIVTHPGISLMLKNITGEDTNKFLYIISGEGNSQQPTIYSTSVEDENARMPILSTGFMFASGNCLFQGALFPTILDDAIIKSFGSATTSDPDDPLHTILWVSRILDPSKYVYHYKLKTVYFHIHVPDFRPKLTE